MCRQREQDPAGRDPTATRQSRVIALRDLIERSVYEVPSEDVAASIIRDALVVAPSPTQQR
jgi:hypothetical protein